MNNIDIETPELADLETEQFTLDSIRMLQLEDRELYLYEEITPITAKLLIEKLRFLDRGSYDDIILYINTPGGSTIDGFALIDCIRNLKSKVIGVAEGRVASMGIPIFASCTQRLVGKNAQFMIHSGALEIEGWINEKDIMYTAKYIQSINEKYASILEQRSSKSKKFWLGKMKIGNDIWFTSEQAIKYGIGDLII